MNYIRYTNLVREGALVRTVFGLLNKFRVRVFLHHYERRRVIRTISHLHLHHPSNLTLEVLLVLVDSSDNFTILIQTAVLPDINYMNKLMMNSKYPFEASVAIV